MPILAILLISYQNFSSYRFFAYKNILSISGSPYIRLSKAFIFPDLEHPTINILYGCSGISDQFGLYYFKSPFVI